MTISSVSDKSNKFGRSPSPEYGIESAIRLRSGAVGQEHGKLLLWPVKAVFIGVLVALSVFGFYSPSTRSVATAASQASSQISHGQAEAALHSRLDGGFQLRLPRFVKNDRQSRVASADMLFEQKYLDSLQGMFEVCLVQGTVYFFHVVWQIGQVYIENFLVFLEFHVK